MYTWGQNQDGQLGLGDCQGRASPMLIEDAALETQNATKVASRISSAILESFLLKKSCPCILSKFERMKWNHVAALLSTGCAFCKAPEIQSSPSNHACKGLMTHDLELMTRDVAPGLQRSQTLRSPHRQRRCLYLGLEQVLPAGHGQCEREGVHALQGRNACSHGQGCELRVVAHSPSCGEMTQAFLEPCMLSSVCL